MSLLQEVTNEEQHPFSFYLEQAARIDHGPRTLKPPPQQRGMLRLLAGCVRSVWHWLQRAKAAQTGGRRLRVTETVSLGEKRFLSIVQVDGAQFLIGSSATSVQLLAQLDMPNGRAVQVNTGTQEIA